MKKVLIVVGGLVLLLVAALAAIFGPVFSGNQPAIDGARLPGDATQVVDGFVSLFILPAGGREVVLVDCGDDPEGAAILGALKARGLERGAVKAIFLTHGHPDHVGGCHLFPGADLYAFAADAKLASGEERAKGPLPSKMAMPKEKAAKVTRTLVDGEDVQVGSLIVKAFAVPGHTAGSGAFLANRTLYLGDSANGRSDGKTLKQAAWIFSDDPSGSTESLIRLHARLKNANADVATLAFGHSGPINGLDALLTVAP